jgi:multiple sugar transport system substrate-binding protein
MNGRNDTRISRRDFLKMATALGVSVGPFFLFPERAQAAQKTLRILQWKHFVPAYDKWFDEVFAPGWARKHDIQVEVEHVPAEELRQRAADEVRTGKGHDLVMFLSPPAAYEDVVIDHREIYGELRHQWGETIEFAHKSTFNPLTKKYFAFSDSYIPAPLNWSKDVWFEAGLPFGPVDYETLRNTGQQIRKAHNIPCGFGLAEEWNSNIALHALLWSFGGKIQDERCHVAINSKMTIEALKYMKALYLDAESPELLRWTPSSGAQAMLEGKISCILHAISISRQAEEKPRANTVLFSPPPRTHIDPLAPPHITQCYVIWTFSENKEEAKQFLVDLIGSFAQAFQASEFCNFPCFPKTVPDLLNQLSSDPKAVPHGKYEILRDALQWTKPIGYPGYATAAVDDVFNNFVLPRMFAKVAKGQVTAEEATLAAEKELEAIFSKQGQH